MASDGRAGGVGESPATAVASDGRAGGVGESPAGPQWRPTAGGAGRGWGIPGDRSGVRRAGRRGGGVGGVGVVVAASGHHLDAHGRDPGRVGGGGVAVGVVVAASGHHLDAHGRDPGRVGGGVGGVLEVVAGADRPGALGQGQPVALAGLAAESDLEAAVGVDVERFVVEDPHDLVVHRPPSGAGLDGDRHVGGALGLAGHPVGMVGGDGGVEVDGVGVVAQQLSVRGDDAMEPGGGRVALEQSDQAPLQVVHQGPVGAHDVVGGVQVPLRRRPAPVGLAQQVDQLVQGPAGLSVYRSLWSPWSPWSPSSPSIGWSLTDGSSRDSRASYGSYGHKTRTKNRAGGISGELCVVWTQDSHQESGGRNLGRVMDRIDPQIAPRTGGRNLGRVMDRIDPQIAPRIGRDRGRGLVLVSRSLKAHSRVTLKWSM